VPASEWLMDNFYIIEEHAKQIKHDFNKQQYKKLPVIQNGVDKGYSRVFVIADNIVKMSAPRKVLTLYWGAFFAFSYCASIQPLCAEIGLPL
jgi:hypothetical protein